MNLKKKYSLFLLICLTFFGWTNIFSQITQSKDIVTIPVIPDTDANNELDDQHALSYMLFNSDLLDIKGITFNETHGGKITTNINIY